MAKEISCREAWDEICDATVKEREVRETSKENSGNRAGAVYQLSKEEWCETTYEIFEKSWNTVINTLEVMPPLENDPSLATFLSMNMTKIRVWENLRSLLLVTLNESLRKRLHNVCRRMETFCIMLMGHHYAPVRESAVRLLNSFYDGHDWQSESPFHCDIKCVGDEFNIESPHIAAYNKTSKYYLFISALPYNWDLLNINDVRSSEYCPGLSPIITVHAMNYIKDEIGNISLIPAKKLTPFPRPGFYDYKIMEVNGDEKRITIDKGRYVVYRKNLDDERWHEIVIDLEGVQWDETQGKGVITKRGTFTEVSDTIEQFSEEGITSLYLLGVLERDNGIEEINGKIVYKRPDASPISIIDRTAICTMIGGKTQFKELMNNAIDNNMKVSIQFDGNISSTRYHRKYRHLFCHTLDIDGQLVQHKGTDAKENQWEDQLLLNYRNIDVWDLFLDDILSLIRNYGIDGVHIREAQSYPIILNPYIRELTRVDTDEKPHYSLLEILQGIVVQPNEECGYWCTKAASTFGYANPFYVRLTKYLSTVKDTFLCTGDSFWGRNSSLAISGILPCSNGFASAMANVTNHKLLKDGSVVYTEENPPINPLTTWLEKEVKCVPKSLLTSTIRFNCNDTLPYPALLYGRGAWTAVDLLYTLPGIPMTFIGEERGRIYRVDLTNVYSTNSNFVMEEMKRKELQQQQQESTKQLLLSNEAEPVEVELHYKAETEEEDKNIMSVAVAGSFNGWSIESHQMKRNKEGEWKINFELAPDRYIYKFVINGNKFICDPNNEEIAFDGFGGNNSVLKVINTEDPRPRASTATYIESATERADEWWGNVDIPEISFIHGIENDSNLNNNENENGTGIGNSNSTVNGVSGSGINSNSSSGMHSVRSWSSLQSARLQENGNTVPRIRSFASMDSLIGLSALEGRQRAELGPEYGFDLLKIKPHYQHRASIRAKYEIFRKGDTIPLRPRECGYDEKHNIFTFARILLPNQIAVVISNVTDQQMDSSFDAKPLEKCVNYMQGWQSPTEFLENCEESDLLNLNMLFTRRNLFKGDEKVEYITPREFILGQSAVTLSPHNSACFLYEKMDIPKCKDGEISDLERHIYRSSLHRLEEVLKGTSTIAYIRQYPLDVNGKCLPLETEVVHQIRFNHIFELIYVSLSLTWSHPDTNTLSISESSTFDVNNCTRDCSNLKRIFDLLCSKLWGDEDDDEEMKKSVRVIRQSLFLASKELNIPSNEIYQWIIELLYKEKKDENSRIKTLCQLLIKDNELGPILFVTPELGRWSTVGGLGVMVDELSQGLALLGCEVYCISPYYHWNRKQETDYLEKDNIIFDKVIQATVEGGKKIPLGVHIGKENGVNLIFLHNHEAFPRPYPGGDPAYQMHCMAVMAKGSLEYCCQYQLFPSVVITNDWFTGLVASYARGNYFGDPSPFRDTSFLHIAHNLDPSYEGRIYPRAGQGTLDNIHELPSNVLKDPYWSGTVLNPSRAAILMSDNWCTVSRSYREDLKNSSPLAPLLNRHPKPFAYPNGILIPARQSKLMELEATTHEGAKCIIQKRYFGFSDYDDSIALYAFVGRITEQKGVHLIANAAEQLIKEHGNKIQFLVGGMANEGDPYAHDCANKLRYLKEKYPSNFWADPGCFFTDGPLVNLGADFGLMPSLFEPGGIVQHEFFVAGTPVIAFKTGGLKDTVHEYDNKSQVGNGFSFESHNHADYVDAIHRSLEIFNNKEEYLNLRVLASAACIDLSEVSWAWYKEFNRIRRCILGMSPVVFRYHYNGAEPKVVELSGDFCSWKKMYKLCKSKSSQNSMELTVYLKPGFYQYKFKVDGEWCIASGYPVHKDPVTLQINNSITVDPY